MFFVADVFDVIFYSIPFDLTDVFPVGRDRIIRPFDPCLLFQRIWGKNEKAG